MRWWENRKHILVREISRLDEKFPDNNFIFEVRGEELWITGTILDFFEFELKYPPSYPSGIPDIFPKDRYSKWVKGHQYVKRGRFCLDIREKTWSSHLSAADIIKSLSVLLIAEGIRLNRGEKDLIVYEESEPTIIEQKSKIIWGVLPKDLDFPTDISYGRISYTYHFLSSTLRVLITGILNDDEKVDSSLVKKIWFSDFIRSQHKGLWIRLDEKMLTSVLTQDIPYELIEFLKRKTVLPHIFSLSDYLEKESDFMILSISDDPQISNFILNCNVKENKISKYCTYSFDLKNIDDRIPNKNSFIHLKSKKVTIIGCGSGGAKDAEYLAKSGVGRIALIDDDILKTENILRHSCPLTSLGTDKVYAVDDVLKKINPDIEIQKIPKRLDVIDSKTDELIRDSDLIMVETASNEELFNEYAFSNNIPAIFSKVYPMGFGGEIIRVIPGVTPCYECSHYYKESIIQETKPDSKFPELETTSYDLLSDGSQIHVPALAIDSDFISLISVKMALEVLLEADLNALRYSTHIRLWSNSKEWIFSQPFECINIDNENIKSLKNCIVCFGDVIIERELNKSQEQINDEYDEILSRVKNAENGDNDGKN